MLGTRCSYFLYDILESLSISALMHIRTSSVATMLAITKHGVCVC